MRIICFILISAAVSQTWAQPPQRDRLDEWLVAAQEALAQGRDGRALRLIRKVLKEEPADPDALRLGLDAAWNSGAYGDADRWSRAWVQSSGSERLARLQRARLLLDLGRADEGLKVLEPLLVAKDPAPPEGPGIDFPARALAARLHSARGRDDEAEKLFDSLVNEAKRVVIRGPENLVALSRAYLYFKGWRQAQEVLIEARKRQGRASGDDLEQESPEVFVAMGEYFLAVHLPPSALKAFDRALKARPKLAPAIAGKAQALFAMRQDGRAEVELRRLLRVNPAHPYPLLRKAAKSLGDMEISRAESRIDTVLKTHPNHLEARSLKAAARLLASDRAGYETELRGVLALDPSYATAHRLIAGVLNDRRRWRECLQQMRTAVGIDPKDPRLWDDLARYAFYLGNEKEGAAALAQAEDLDAANRVWRRNMRKLARTLERDFVTVESKHFLHRLYKDEAELLAPYVKEMAEESYRLLTKRYGFVPKGLDGHEGVILVEHFDRHQEFAVRTYGFTNLGALGVCFGPFIALDSPSAAKDKAWFRTFHHELAHTLTLGMSKGRVPRWLTEGLSTLEEWRFDSSWDRGLYRQLHSAWATGELLGVEHFDAAFSTPRVIYAYFQGGLCCRFMEERFGWKKVLAMVRAYALDRSTKTILRDVFNLSPKEFDAHFKSYVGEMMAPVALIPSLSGSKFQELDEHLKESPKDFEALVLVANALLQRGNALDAQELVLRGGKIKPGDPRIDYLNGRIALLGRDSKRARSSFEAALRKGFKDHDLHMALARLVIDEDPREARRQLEAAVATFPFASGPSDPRLLLAKLLMAAGEVEGAIAQLEAHLGTTFDDIDTRKKLIAYDRRQGLKRRLRYHLEKLLLLRVKDPVVHLEIGQSYVDAAQWPLAKREARAALVLTKGKSASDEAGARVLLGTVLLRGEQDAEGALEEAEEALLLVPGHAQAARLKRQASVSLKKKDRSR